MAQRTPSLLAGALLVVGLLGAAQSGQAFAKSGIASPSLATTSPGLIQPVAVFGRDRRSPLPRHMQDLAHSVGYVTSDVARTICTAFCVGRRTVATASHCLFRTAGERRPDLAGFQFHVGGGSNRRQSRIMGHQSRTHGQHVIAGSAALRITPPIDATRDWALMRLEKPLCRDHSLFVEPAKPKTIHRLASRGRLLNVSFHGDLRQWRLSISRHCRTMQRLGHAIRRQIKRDFSDRSSLLLHDCDTGPASSGSPLLALSPDNRLRVVAMNIGTYHQTRYRVTGRSVTRRYKPATVANTAVSGSAFADQILRFARADILTERRLIRRLQQALGVAGFDAGSADGIYGDRTRAAVVAFETATDRPAHGLVTRQLLRAVERYSSLKR